MYKSVMLKAHIELIPYITLSTISFRTEHSYTLVIPCTVPSMSHTASRYYLGKYTQADFLLQLTAFRLPWCRNSDRVHYLYAWAVRNKFNFLVLIVLFSGCSNKDHKSNRMHDKVIIRRNVNTR